VSELQIGDSLRLASLRLPDGVTSLDDPETVIATVTTPMREEEPEEEAVEGEEGEVAEGEEAAAAEGEAEAGEAADAEASEE